MDPIDYTPLPSAPPEDTVLETGRLSSNSSETALSFDPQVVRGPMCIVCNRRAPYMFFPCGCTCPVHAPCLRAWREHHATCPRCNTVWVSIENVSQQPLLPSQVIVSVGPERIQTHASRCLYVILSVFLLLTLGIGAWSWIWFYPHERH